MNLLPCFCAVVILALGCLLSGCLGRPHGPYQERSGWPYQEPEEQEEERRSGKLEDELWMLKRILERNQGERELEPSRQELQRQQRNQMHPRAFLEQFGYLPTLPKNVSHEPTSMRSAVIHMQQMYHIKETGELDDKTMSMMQMPRCGMPDATPKEYMNTSRTRSNSISALKTDLIAQNFYVPGYKWQKTDLTWRLKNYHQLLSAEVTRNALRQAFKYWSDVSGLTFTETASKADINLEFAAGIHEDGPGNAFDGPSMVLAHAFYPESGETHFDWAEHWTDGKQEGINLKIVAAHELGHALGLGHSKVAGALMAPVYQGYEPNFKLREDDIFAIQSLYGGSRAPNNPTFQNPVSTTEKSRTSGTKASTTDRQTPAPGGPPTTCELTYKAITQTHDYRIYVYNGRWMWRTSDYGLDQGFPLTISTYYEDPPEDISAVIFSWRTYHTYFFKNKSIWKYYGFQRVAIKTVESSSYRDSPKAAIASKDGTIYLIKDGSAWKFDENKLDTDGNPISFVDLFPGAPTNFDSAVRLVNDAHIYFFRGQNYEKYSEDSRRVLEGYPKPKAGPWMGPACGAKPYTPK